MKPSAFLLFATVLLASAAAHGAPFEGKVQLMRAEPPDRPHEIFYWVKGDKNRVEVWRERANAFLNDTKKAETTVILEDDRAYLILPWLEPQREVPQLEKTNETAKLLGHGVQKYVLTSDEGTTELWLAEGFGKYTGFGDGFEKPPEHVPNVDIPPPPQPRIWEYALAGTSFFPLRVITRDEDGREIFRLEAKAITPQSVDDRLFAPSPTYKKVETWPKSDA